MAKASDLGRFGAAGRHRGGHEPRNPPRGGGGDRTPSEPSGNAPELLLGGWGAEGRGETPQQSVHKDCGGGVVGAAGGVGGAWGNAVGKE